MTFSLSNYHHLPTQTDYLIRVFAVSPLLCFHSRSRKPKTRCVPSHSIIHYIIVNRIGIPKKQDIHPTIRILNTPEKVGRKRRPDAIYYYKRAQKVISERNAWTTTFAKCTRKDGRRRVPESRQRNGRLHL